MPCLLSQVGLLSVSASRGWWKGCYDAVARYFMFHNILLPDAGLRVRQLPFPSTSQRGWWQNTAMPQMAEGNRTGQGKFVSLLKPLGTGLARQHERQGYWLHLLWVLQEWKQGWGMRDVNPNCRAPQLEIRCVHCWAEASVKAAAVMVAWAQGTPDSHWRQLYHTGKDDDSS